MHEYSNHRQKCRDTLILGEVHRYYTDLRQNCTGPYINNPVISMGSMLVIELITGYL